MQVDVKRPRFDPWVWKIPWRRKWQPTPVLLPRESQGRGSLMGCRLWGRTESDTLKQLSSSSSSSSSSSRGSAVKNLLAMQEIQKTQVQSLGQEAPLEEEIATHTNILAKKIPWIEEPGRLQSTGSQRVGHD